MKALASGIEYFDLWPRGKSMIRTLLVDDSRAYLTALRAALATDPDFEVVGEAHDGAEALVLARALVPQLVLMDVQMPGQGGIAATAQLMQDAPCAVVVMSSTVSPESQQPAFEALRAGAVEVVSKPRDLASPVARDRLLGLLKAMAAVKVVRRRAVGGPAVSVVALGSSTGGPPALCEVLGALPRDFAPSVLIAQHLAPGFSAGLRQWLASAGALPVELVKGSTARLPGTVYLAGDGLHLLADGDFLITRPMAPSDRAGPSVNLLFKSTPSPRTRAARSSTACPARRARMAARARCSPCARWVRAW
jgi:two-component system chemotaxis response regulator CheB